MNTRFKKGHIPWNKGRLKVFTPSTLAQMSIKRIKWFEENPHWSKGKRGVYSLRTLDKMSLAHTGKKHSESTKRKISKSVGGEKHYNWRGGKTALKTNIYNSFEYRQWRSDVFTRDGFICQECGDGKGGNLESHHIKSLYKILKEYNIKKIQDALMCEELWNINNGKTLCKKCHRKTNNYGKRRQENE